jgi:tocopherol cyclase
MKEMLKIKKLSNSSIFQGNLKKKQYFEGWYYKLVDPTEKISYAFIPGISLDKKRKTSHAFVQMLDGRTGEPFYFSYPLEAFQASSHQFEVKIGPNYFTNDRIRLNIQQAGHSINGTLRFKDLVPWPKYFLAPGIMGWYTYIPFMECYHGVVSMNHTIDGQLSINQKTIDFTKGLGYIEKDWGTSFPSGYIWLQSNHFTKGETSFMASIAKIPFIGLHFTGFLFALWHKGKIYRFTTYTGAKIQKIDIKPKRLKAIVADRNHIIAFDAKKVHKEGRKAPAELAGVLKSPTSGEMKGRIMESLTSEVTLSLYSRDKRGRRGDLIFTDTGYNTGLEIEATKEDLEL